MSVVGPARRRQRTASGSLAPVAIAVLGITLFTAACATPKPPPAADVLSRRDLAYLVDGSTTREQALLRLGLPSRSFEGERILLFRLGWTEREGLAPVAWHSAALAGYDLVLVFDAQGVLARHALVAK